MTEEQPRKVLAYHGPLLYEAEVLEDVTHTHAKLCLELWADAPTDSPRTRTHKRATSHAQAHAHARLRAHANTLMARARAFVHMYENT
eukprot:6176495-Pleurochrysis_carterae.AAC.3